MIDLILLAIVALVTWCVAAEGPFGAIITFLSVVFAGLLAMDFFEPIAAFLQTRNLAWGNRFDLVALVGTFALFTFLFRMAADYVAPSDVPLASWAYNPLRWGFGFLTGYVTMAILLTALHTSMLPRDFIGFKPERKNFLTMSAPDREWLAFTQHASESLFPRRLAISAGGTIYRLFDGAIYKVPDRPQSVYLPTFIIRYASRRQRGTRSLQTQTPPPFQPSPGAAPGDQGAPAGL